MEYRVLLYASCNNGTTTKEFLFDTRIKELVPHIETEFQKKECWVINFCNTDEKRLIAKGIPTISAQTLISIAGGCSFRTQDMDFIFMRGARIRYSEIFGEEKMVDFSLVFQSNRFWGRIACIIQESIGLIYEYGLQRFLLLEIKVIPVLHEMFDAPYPMDSECAKKVYEGLRRELTIIQKQIKHKNLEKGRTEEMKPDDKEIQALICQQKKLENKLIRFPKELSGIQSPKAYISSKFRSIGTDTFRISTYSTNIQGFPKELRQCLLPRYGNKLIEYDIVCSQLILLAGFAGEDSLIQCYLENKDLYTFLSAEILGKPEDEITMEERNVYKTVILQTLYGAGINTIHTELQGIGCKMDNDEIREFKRRFYRLFPAIRKYSEKVKTVEEITLPTGRNYCMKNIKPYARLSHILQYIEAEILRQILIALYEKGVEMGFSIYLCIHDSIFIETSNEDITQICGIVQKCFNYSVKEYFERIKRIRVKENIIYG